MVKRLKYQEQENAFIGCLLGTAVGDAMGLSYEGLSPQRLIKLYPAIDKYHLIFGKGLVSDDTEHTCLVAQSLIVSGHDINIFKKTLAWKLRGWLLGLPAGIGFATLKGIVKLWLGFSPDNSGVFSAGNGPAMRSAIIGVCYGHDEEKLKRFVKVATRITHTDPKAELGALAVAVAAYLSSLKKTVSPQDYLEKLEKLLYSSSLFYLPEKERQFNEESLEEFFALLKKTIDSISSGQSTTDFAQTLGLHNGVSGYIYHTLPMVIHLWLKNQENYQSAILDVIRCGGDTDTVAAIVGGIIGARVGEQGIPPLWLANLWEFPRNIRWMKKLGQRLNQTGCFGIKQQSLSVSLVSVFLRNIIFMIIVLLHGFRRLLPPY
ncbi:ADP-ribosylation/Crystallin J1 [Beggiatoa sp. PS]|nr:ADP-ribosylation/Crystallin J1 [Beggiatoa sp. PS]